MEAEHAILERVRAGDTRAFGLLIARHTDGAYTLAVRILRSREEAEETVQDAFLRAYQSLGSFRGESRFGTWLYRIVFNLSMTRVSRRRPPAHSLDVLTEEECPVALDADGLDVLEKMERDEQVRQLDQLMKMLPEAHRIAVELFYLQEQSYEEIADIMDIPLGTVKTYLFRGRARLRSLLAREVDKNVRAA